MNLLTQASAQAGANSSQMAVVVAPLGRDAELICALLQRSSIECIALPAAEEAIQRIYSAGVLVIAEEALNSQLILQIAEVLRNQPPWSDIPIILLTMPGEVTQESQRRRVQREPLGNVLLLERPSRPETLISSVRSALRARARQYQIRDQIEQYQHAEEALRKSEKLAVAGRLAASIAHEINNPLESVTNLLYLMRSSASDAQLSEYGRLAEQELARVTEIAKQTLQFYRESAPHAPTHVADVLESVLQLYGPRLSGRHVTVETELRRGAPVTASAGELRQLFANLIGNALDAMRSGGRLRIRTRPAREHSERRRYGVRISVADTGTGIPQHLRKRVFEPFVTTKGDTGTGLGLWVTSEIVEKYSGRIFLRSSAHPQKSGTVFHVFLPYRTSGNGDTEREPMRAAS
ncbi:MAG TPA: ATP-binding protein [Acidobacteriaceae bacterium]|nr:ATP-binding protein [Acidobacteriaceae bacterium]